MNLFHIQTRTIQVQNILLIISLAFLQSPILAQSQKFPDSWTGNWKGDLTWIKPGNAETQTVKMQLNIHPTDSAGQYTWQIIYGEASEDNRPYVLKAIDKNSGHWVIDERNGIVLNQFLIGNIFCGAFTVENSTILNNYRLNGDELHIEFYSMRAKPLTVTGYNTDDSPSVDSYKISGYQKAILRRTQ